MSRRTIRRALVSGAALGCIAGTAAYAASTAAAATPTGTITYIQGNNVWLTTPDGQIKRQLTKDGTAGKPWNYPQIAPDGSVHAVQGNDIVHLAPGGEVLSRFAPARLRGPDGKERETVPPEWLSLSPDGTRLAWGAWAWGCSEELDPTCKYSSISGITDVDRVTSIDKYGQSQTIRFPTWVSNNRLIGAENSDSFWMHLWDLGKPSTRWFETKEQLGQVWDFRDPDVSPSRRNIAVVALRPNQQGLIVIARSATDLSTGTPAVPPPLCGITETHRVDASPSWSPDGLELAYSDAKGVQVNTWTKEIESEADCVTPEPRTIAPAGSKSPDWGASNVLRPPVETPPPGGGTPPGGGSTPPPGGGGTPPSGGTPAGGGSTPPAGGGSGTPSVESPKACVIPKVKAGASLTSVRGKLGGCTVKVVRQRSKAVKKGRVVKVSRKAGTRPAGTKVTVYVSKGGR